MPKACPYFRFFVFSPNFCNFVTENRRFDGYGAADDSRSTMHTISLDSTHYELLEYVRHCVCGFCDKTAPHVFTPVYPIPFWNTLQ